MQEQHQDTAFIRTTTLRKTSLEDSISSTGLVASNNVSNVTTNLNAAVKSVEVSVGDYVEEGDVIVTLDTVKLAIAAIAAISLLVGGIGVMNIMMVSITERTREIGTRKALGAPNFTIRMQFIVEAVVICLIGGGIGIALGIGLGAAASQMLGYAAKPSVFAILAAFSFSMAIGVFFGYYPANKAAKLDPIEALRYE